MSSNESRRLNIQDVNQGHIHLIEANAGTGKTYAIANLFLRYILDDYDIHSILVVTFTNAARDELRSRIRKRLTEALQMFNNNSVDDNEDEFFKSLLDRHPEGNARTDACLRIELALLSMNEASIYTIHGFCQQALTEHAVSSNQSFDLEQVDNQPIKKEVIRDWWRCRTYDLSLKEFQWFQKHGFEDIDALETVIDPLLGANAPDLYIPNDINIDSVDELIKESSKIMAGIINEWSSDNEKIRSRLVDKLKYKLKNSKHVYREDKKLPNLFNSLDFLRDIKKTKGEISVLDSNETNFIPYGYDTLSKNLNKGGDPKDFDLPFFRLIDEYIISLDRLEAAYPLAEIHRAKTEIGEQLSKLKQQRGLLSFDDMIELLHKAVTNPTQVGDRLSSTLAKQFPLVMVDEFQDTDPLQYEIFHDIHRAETDHTLIMIGDPKQAIYSFRGGDIFTYMQAQNDADYVWTLSTNWRSTPEMIQAFNHIFARDNAFTYEAIQYHDSEPPLDDKCKANPLYFDGREQSAMIFQEIPGSGDGELLKTKESIYEQIHQATAERIARMLADNSSRIGDEPLQPGDIAVVVREKHEATALQDHLLNHGIRSVTIADASVWNTEEANSLKLLIKATATPGNRDIARQALGVPVLGLYVEEIHHIQTSSTQWTRWVELFYAVHDLWLKNGFMTAYQHLLHGICNVVNELTEKPYDLHTDTWLSRSNNPERMLTNLTHLGELLQQASLEHPDMSGLLSWMQQQESEKEKDENLLRLESDEKLVKMITLHTSKGLQFPVVFLPYLWHCKPKDNKAKDNIAMKWHEPHGQGFRCFYTSKGSIDHPEFLRAEHERLAEDVRLAYVALTRAESHCHIIFGPTQNNQRWKGHPGQTAIAWLLASEHEDLDLDSVRFEIDPEHITLDRLKECSSIQIFTPQQTSVATAPSETEDRQGILLEPSLFTRDLYSNWRITSFSSMASGVHQATHTTAGDIGDSFALQYPAGAHVGSFLHALLEYIEPDQPLRSQLERLVKRHALSHGLDPEQDLDGLESWLHDILNTQLDESGLTLAGINPGSQLHELKFDFSTRRVGHKALHECLIEYAGTELPKVNFHAFEGMVTGIIDLVFEHEGRYYLADYKSNLLSRRLDDYNTENLQPEIHNRRYDLQYLLYTLALHRHLRQRLPDYEYEHHFGGVFYLFLRGMTPATGPNCGVFFDYPPLELIEKLDQEIFVIPEALAS